MIPPWTNRQRRTGTPEPTPKACSGISRGTFRGGGTDICRGDVARGHFLWRHRLRPHGRRFRRLRALAGLNAAIFVTFVAALLGGALMLPARSAQDVEYQSMASVENVEACVTCDLR